MKILLYGDTQIHPYASWSKPTGDGRTSKLQMYTKFFDWLEEIAIDHQVKHIFHLGDLFENGNTIDTASGIVASEGIAQLRRVAERNGGRHFILVGNHDLKSRSTALNTPSIISTDVLSEPEGLILVDQSEEFSVKETIHALVGTLPYGIQSIPESPGRPFDFYVSHAQIKGAMLNNRMVDIDGIPAESFLKITFSGHYHHPGQLGNVVFVGCPFYLDYRDSVVDEPRGVVIYDTSSGKYERILNPWTPRFFTLHLGDKIDHILSNIDKFKLSTYVRCYLPVDAPDEVVQVLKDHQCIVKVVRVSAPREKLVLGGEVSSFKLDPLTLIDDYVRSSNTQLDQARLTAYGHQFAKL